MISLINDDVCLQDGSDSYVLGYSGGGPYALAAAQALPDRVATAAVVSGAGQVGVWASVRASVEAWSEVPRQRNWGGQTR